MQNRIREIRRALRPKVTQEAVAAALGKTKSQISKLENGKMGLTYSWMRDIARILGCRPQDLIWEDTTKKIPISGIVNALGEIKLGEVEPDVSVSCPQGVPPDQVIAVRSERFILDRVAGDNSIFLFGRTPDILPAAISGVTRAIWINSKPLGSGPFAEFLRRPCVVKTKKGQLLIRQLLPGTEPGRFDLHSQAGIEENVEVIECLHILVIFPA